MTKLLDTLDQVARGLPVEVFVGSDLLRDDKLPKIVVSRERGSALDQSKLSVRMNTEADVFIGFAGDIKWEDIELVTGAIMDGLLKLRPATDILSVEYGSGAAGKRLAKCTISSGDELILDPLDSEFTFSY